MSAFSNFLENALLNHVLRGGISNTGYPQPLEIWMSLHFTNPAEVGTSELSPVGNGYARQLATFAEPVGGLALTDNAQAFINLPSSNVTHVGLWTEQTGGDFLYGGPLTPPRAVTAGDNITFNAGGFGVRHD